MRANEKTISERVIGCAFAVGNQLGPGFLENVYESALAFEMTDNGIPFERQKSLQVFYRGVSVGHYVADFVVKNELILEIKALSHITQQHEAQVMNYLQATGLTVGLLLNFGTTKVGVRRLVKTYDDSKPI